MAFLLAFITALGETMKDIIARRVSPTIPVAELLFWYKLFSILIVLPFALLNWRFENTPGTYILVASDGLLNIFAFYFYLRALSLSPVSLMVPLLAFSPALLLITSPIMLGEFPDSMGLAGILLITAGSYILYMEDSGNPLSPIRALLREKGSRYMMATVLLWSITANLDKMGTRATSPVVWVLLINVFVAAGAFIMMRKGVKGDGFSRPHPASVLMGLADGVGAVAQMTALKLTIVPYVISIKRLSVLMSVIAGTTFLKEGKALQRITGTALMLTGSALILFNM